MRARTFLTGIATGLSLLTLGATPPQSHEADVTFEVPLNLTGLTSQFTQIAVNCTIESLGLMGGLSGQTEVAVSQGQVVQTVQVIVPIGTSQLNSPAGKSATYECRLKGRNQGAEAYWRDLHSSGMAYTILPQPVPITGSFWW